MTAFPSKPIPRSFAEPVCAALAAVIRQRRQRAGWSRNELAARTNLSHPMIRFVETQQRVPTVDTMARISRAFGLPLSRLVAEAEELFSPRQLCSVSSSGGHETVNAPAIPVGQNSNVLVKVKTT